MYSHLILYVMNQEKSTSFYEKVLDSKPVLNVPGMTEFELNSGCKLGLMPYSGVQKLLGVESVLPEEACKNPNSELYIVVDDPIEYHCRSLNNGGEELSAVQKRDWGHLAGYSRDIDGHIIVFAKPY